MEYNMTFDDVIKLFMDSIEESSGGDTLLTYRRKIYVFQEYVITELEARDVNYQSILSAMTKQQLLDAVAYYVKTYSIRYVTTVDNYLTVVGLFFDFIADKFGWRNQYFETNSKKQELKNAYIKSISDLHLNEKERIEPLTNEEATRLLNRCDYYIGEMDIQSIEDSSNNGKYSYYISSIISKMVLLFGIKNGYISTLQLKDYDEQYNKLRINGFWVHLPDKFAAQIREYLKIRKKILAGEKENLLFIDIRKDKRKLSNGKMFTVLKEVTGNTKATSIAKYSIIQMINSGLPSHIIKDFTGYKDDVFQFCIEKSDDEKGVYGLKIKNRILETKIRNIQMFDDMV